MTVIVCIYSYKWKSLKQFRSLITHRKVLQAIHFTRDLCIQLGFLQRGAEGKSVASGK